MLAIRLTRKGKKNQPFFRLVVTDKRNSTKGGRAVEVLGYVDPLTKKKSLEVERIKYWISKGAQPSATVNNLLIQEKVIDGKKVHVSKISKKKQAEIDKAKEAVNTKVPAVETPAEVPAAVEEVKPAEEVKPEAPAKV